MDYTTQMQNLISMLWGLKRGVYREKYAAYGVCHQLTVVVDAGLITRTLRDFVKWRMQQWPEYTGHPDYPVPGVAKYAMCPEDTYSHTKSGEYFSGEYGGNRIRLVNFLIRELEAELAAYDAG